MISYPGSNDTVEGNESDDSLTTTTEDPTLPWSVPGAVPTRVGLARRRGEDEGECGELLGCDSYSYCDDSSREEDGSASGSERVIGGAEGAMGVTYPGAHAGTVQESWPEVGAVEMAAACGCSSPTTHRGTCVCPAITKVRTQVALSSSPSLAHVCLMTVLTPPSSLPLSTLSTLHSNH